MSNSDRVSIIDEHPLPTDVEEAEEFQNKNPTFSETESEPLHPDELREYQQVIAENGEWRVFSLHIYGYESVTFVWNCQLGYGLRFNEQAEMERLAEVMSTVTEVLALDA